MKLTGDAHLTYCTNIHAGETWDEVDRVVRTHVMAVKARVCPEAPFGVGLRLSAAAARALAEPNTLAAFRQFLADSDLYVFTVNGFPYGPFHGVPVKEHVYRPDWLEDERLAYTDELATILAALLPRTEALEGSISTVPGCFRARGTLATSGPQIAARLRAHAARLWRLHEAGGPVIGLALEPEPECLLETTGDAVALFRDHVFSPPSVTAFAAETGLSSSVAEATLRRHLGVCLDACHAAVEYESPAEAVGLLAAVGVRVLKLQVSAGLRVPRPDSRRLEALRRFAEGVYLHQVVIRRGNSLSRVLDLDEALRDANPRDAGDEWRIHFHVPVFREELGPFQSTNPFLTELLTLQSRAPFTRHLEVETYTWDVLPEEHRRESVVDAIARELAWTHAQLAPGTTP